MFTGLNTSGSTRVHILQLYHFGLNSQNSKLLFVAGIHNFSFRASLFGRELGDPASLIVNPIKLQTGLRPNSAGIPYTLLLRIEAMGFPTVGLLLYIRGSSRCFQAQELIRSEVRTRAFQVDLGVSDNLG